MDDVWKYNGDVEGVKRTQYSSVSTSVQKSDPSQVASSSFGEREAVTSGEDVMRLPSPTPPFSSLSQDWAATSNATWSSVSGPNSVSELGEGRSSPQTEVSRTKVSLGRPFFNHPGSEAQVFKLEPMPLTHVARCYNRLHGLIMWNVRLHLF